MKKGWIYLGLVLTLILSAMLPVETYAAGQEASDWARESVERAIALRLVPDDLQSDFQQNITRREFCHIAMGFVYSAWPLSPEFPDDMPSPFTDVDDRLVTIAHQLGITSGQGDGLFNPDGLITRQEAAVMLHNMAVDYYRDIVFMDDNFDDSDLIADWAKRKVGDLAGSGVLKGVSGRIFDPLGHYTREQCYVSVLRLYDMYDRHQADIAQTQTESRPETAQAQPKTEPAAKEELHADSGVISGELHALVKDNVISVSARGSTIQQSKLSFVNKTQRKVEVLIPYGTWLKSNSSSVQNMLVTITKTITLGPGEDLDETVSTACLNMRRNIPDASNGMTVDYYEENHKLTQLTALLRENQVNYPVIQAAVWIITDDATDNDLSSILVDSSGKSAISPNDIKRAREIVDQLK